jgi:hypothetical protein
MIDYIIDYREGYKIDYYSHPESGGLQAGARGVMSSRLHIEPAPRAARASEQERERERTTEG